MKENDWKRRAVKNNELIILNTPPGQQTSVSKVNTKWLFYQYCYQVPASVSQAWTDADTKHIVPDNPARTSEFPLETRFSSAFKGHLMQGRHRGSWEHGGSYRSWS